VTPSKAKRGPKSTSDLELAQAHRAWMKAGRNQVRAAAELGISKDAMHRRLTAWDRMDEDRKAAQQGMAPDFDITHAVPAGLTLRGTSIQYDANDKVKLYWNKTKPQGLHPEEVFQLPDPKKVTKTSTLFDGQGNVSQQWVSEKAEDKDREALWIEFAKALASEIPRAEPSTGPAVTDTDLMALYPVGDHHMGMLSWDQETGENWDLGIGETMLADAIDYLVAAAPACSTALIALLGDFMHYDSFEAVTPTSRNVLDADGRFPKMVRAAIRSIRYLIKAALAKHGKVHVKIEIGNHDLSSSIFLMECLANIYEDDARVTIDTSPMHYHYFEFGKNLIGTHHGHGTKMEKLPLIMATDMPEAWGRTIHRLWLTGHIHSRTVQDYAGCSVESLRILAPSDAWAHQKGYRSARDMKSMIMHREHGEVARHTVNPAMCRKMAA
jgi:hypothetical protein